MKKKKKITRPVGKRPETTRCDGVTTYYRKGKLCHCSSKRFPGSSEERDRRCAARTLNQRQRASVFALVSRLVKILTRKPAGLQRVGVPREDNEHDSCESLPQGQRHRVRRERRGEFPRLHIQRRVARRAALHPRHPSRLGDHH